MLTIELFKELVSDYLFHNSIPVVKVPTLATLFDCEKYSQIYYGDFPLLRNKMFLVRE